MRVAWQRNNAGNDVEIAQGSTKRLIYIAYNIFFWVPLLLPFTGIIDYQTGFLFLLLVTCFRAIANFYRNNFLTLEQAEYFPLRSP